MSEALKPCPFCGNKKQAFLKLDKDVYGNFFIRCFWCGAGGRLVSKAINAAYKKTAIAAWNMRKEAAE
ncbi:MAG: Lar family restriction alleviation protein [Spirochaetaceae bacterium]|jgi:Lar family restriction alleviation protein|nr:Lar family restriction alleviation protein [Spirochaetaceae bacterium]